MTEKKTKKKKKWDEKNQKKMTTKNRKNKKSKKLKKMSSGRAQDAAEPPEEGSVALQDAHKATKVVRSSGVGLFLSLFLSFSLFVPFASASTVPTSDLDQFKPSLKGYEMRSNMTPMPWRAQTWMASAAADRGSLFDNTTEPYPQNFDAQEDVGVYCFLGEIKQGWDLVVISWFLLLVLSCGFTYRLGDFGRYARKKRKRELKRKMHSFRKKQQQKKKKNNTPADAACTYVDGFKGGGINVPD